MAFERVCEVPAAEVGHLLGKNQSNFQRIKDQVEAYGQIKFDDGQMRLFSRTLEGLDKIEACLHTNRRDRLMLGRRLASFETRDSGPQELLQAMRAVPHYTVGGAPTRLRAHAEMLSALIKLGQQRCLRAIAREWPSVVAACYGDCDPRHGHTTLLHKALFYGSFGVVEQLVHAVPPARLKELLSACNNVGEKPLETLDCGRATAEAQEKIAALLMRHVGGDVATHGLATHGPTTHGPATTHGPTTHGPTTHGPTTHGPATHGPTTHGPTALGTSKKHARAAEANAFDRAKRAKGVQASSAADDSASAVADSLARTVALTAARRPPRTMQSRPTSTPPSPQPTSTCRSPPARPKRARRRPKAAKKAPTKPPHSKWDNASNHSSGVEMPAHRYATCPQNAFSVAQIDRFVDNKMFDLDRTKLYMIDEDKLTGLQQKSVLHDPRKPWTAACYNNTFLRNTREQLQYVKDNKTTKGGTREESIMMSHILTDGLVKVYL
jgi:hypothetical protein